MTTRTKATILQEIQEARAVLTKLVGSIPESRLEEPNAEGTWSVRDVLGHIATWDEVSAERVRELAGGGAPAATPGDFNEREVKMQQALSTERIKELFVKNHVAAMGYLRTLPDEALRRPDVEKQVMGCMAHHYVEHAESLRKWLSKG